MIIIFKKKNLRLVARVSQLDTGLESDKSRWYCKDYTDGAIIESFQRFNNHVILLSCLDSLTRGSRDPTEYGEAGWQIMMIHTCRYAIEEK